MVIDTFSYFNEEELLELRIKMLYDYVDKFIICEGDHTHKGDYKGFVLENTLTRLKIPTDKIKAVKVFMPSKEEQPNAWIRERMQRDAAAAYITSEDICIVGDLDEIPDPTKIKLYTSFARNLKNTILYLDMYNLQQRADLEVQIDNRRVYWRAAYVCNGQALTEYTLSQFREGLTMFRKIAKFDYQYVYEPGIPHVAGWHFSWMGNKTQKQNKLNNFLHWDEFEKLYTEKDILGRERHNLVDFNTELLPDLIHKLPNVKKYLLP